MRMRQSAPGVTCSPGIRPSLSFSDAEVDGADVERRRCRRNSFMISSFGDLRLGLETRDAPVGAQSERTRLASKRWPRAVVRLAIENAGDHPCPGRGRPGGALHEVQRSFISSRLLLVLSEAAARALQIPINAAALPTAQGRAGPPTCHRGRPERITSFDESSAQKLLAVAGVQVASGASPDRGEVGPEGEQAMHASSMSRGHGGVAPGAGGSSSFAASRIRQTRCSQSRSSPRATSRLSGSTANVTTLGAA